MKHTQKLSNMKLGFLRQSKNAVAVVFVVLFAAVGMYLLISSRAAVALSSVKSGNWSDPTVWSSGTVPGEGDTVTVAATHTVTFDLAASPKLGETYVRGTLTFAPGKSVKLVTNRNVIVTGKLVMRPSAPTIDHFINFVDVNESNFVGGGMTPLPTDVGMWVMDAGQLDIAGAPKRGWSTTSTGANVGATSVTLKEAPTGWRVGDTISIAPNEAPTVGAASYRTFDERVITAISGNTVSFAQGLSRARPYVNSRWGAEVANLTRNVRIEGTYKKHASEGDDADQDRHSGNSHIFIHATKPQHISHAQLRYMGSMGIDESNRDNVDNPKLGRYALHFHHMGHAARGSMVDGVVVRDANFRSYVPHASHGITIKDSIAYKVKGSAFWWDFKELDPNSDSHDSIWDHNLVAHVIPRNESAGFFLPAGHNNKLTNSSVVGVQDNAEQGGYFWVNENVGVWVFDGNVAHNNNDNGITVWQNTDHVHVIRNFAMYYNHFYGISHGAYANDYTYSDGFVYGNKVSGVELGANSHSLNQQKWENIVFDGAGITPVLISANHSSLAGAVPILIRDSTFRNYTQNAIRMQGIGNTEDAPKKLDIVNPVFEGASPIAYGTESSNPENIVRVQPKTGQSYHVKPGNVMSSIAAFAPTTYGNGYGLKAEHFNNNTLSGTPVMRRLEFNAAAAYAEDEAIPPYWITPWPKQFTVRLSGQFEAQFSEPYTFVRDEGAGMRVWVNNQQVLNAWTPTESQVAGSPISLIKGQKYDIRIEVLMAPSGDVSRDSAIYNLFMQSPSQPKIGLPMSQLYCGTDPVCDVNAAVTPQPTPSPDTTAPTITLTAPTAGATLSGTFSMNAAAQDNVGVAQVDFLIDNVVRKTTNASPYTFSVNTTQLNLSNGTHTLAVRAWDSAGNNKATTPITVTTNNQTTTPTYRAEDINQDGVINLVDFSLLSAKFGQTGSSLGRADINGDGAVNMLDFSRLAAAFSS